MTATEEYSKRVHPSYYHKEKTSLKKVTNPYARLLNGHKSYLNLIIKNKKSKLIFFHLDIRMCHLKLKKQN